MSDRTMVASSLGAMVPRNRVRVSDSCPVTWSTSVRSSTPFDRPAQQTAVMKPMFILHCGWPLPSSM